MTGALLIPVSLVDDDDICVWVCPASLQAHREPVEMPANDDAASGVA